MTDKERIEEMAKEIEFAKKGLWNAVNVKDESYDWHSRGIAKHLFGMGYRKIPEGSIVLSKEEYQNEFNSQFNKGYKQGSKETAREILQELFKEHTVFNDNDVIIAWQVKEILKEAAKQFGVEVEE